MPITGPVSVSGQSNKEYSPMPIDVYQFEVLDVVSKEGKKYQSDEVESKFSFTFVCIEPGAFYGRRIWRETNTKFVGGQKPSNLFTVISGITNRTFSREECENAGSVITDEFLNSLIGVQVRLSIGQKRNELTGKTNNIIASYLPVKAQLPVFDPEKKPEVVLDAEVPEV